MSDSHETNDTEIVQRIIAGGEDAFSDLLDKYGGFVLTIVKKHVPFEHVEDTAQDVFLRIYRALPSFKNHESFKSWLSVIAMRTCYDFWRQKYKSREMVVSSLSEDHQKWISETLSDDYDAQRSLQKEAREVLDWALSKLSAGDRMVLELVYLEENSLKDAAKLLGLSIANVKVRLFRSRKKLQKLLVSEDG